MAHIASAAILATTFLPERDKILASYTDHDDQRRYENYDKNEVIRLILMHDIGEYKSGDISKLQRTPADNDNEKNAVECLKIIGSVMNSNQLQHFANPQETICNYWNHFDKNDEDSDINVAIAHDLDALECLLQLHKYADNEKNTISDFNDFKEDLEKSIKTKIVDSLGKLLLGDKNYK